MTDRSGPLPPTLFLGAVAAQVLLYLALPSAAVLPEAMRVIGGLSLLAGLALTAAADAQFKRARTEIDPFGQPSTLVESGAFRISRNPMYLGLVVALVGIGLLLGSAAALAVPPLFALVLGVRFIPHEERTMLERFGDAYVAYARRVRRWI